LRTILRAAIAAACVVCAWSQASAAVIVTTSGEEIVCEIVRETDTYFVVDHRGYRRYVLKTQVRSLDRRAGEGFNLGPEPLRNIEFSGGYRLWGRSQSRGIGASAISASYPLNENLLIQLGVEAGRGEASSSFEGGDLLPGPISWVGGMCGAQWQLQPWRVRPFLDAGIGYFAMRHSVADSGVLWMKQAIAAIDGDTSFVYSEPMDGAFAVRLGVGALVPLSGRFALTLRTSILVLHTGFTRQWYYPTSAEQEEMTLRSSHGITLEMIHTTAGVQWAF